MTPSRDRAAVVYNPIKVDVAALRTAVDTATASADWDETLWFETTEDDPGFGQAKQAVAEGATLVIAAGGDGTVRCTAEGIHGTDARLGIVPAGTGNLLARNLDLPLGDVAAAVDIAVAGTDRTIDVGRVQAERADGTRTTNIFLVLAGVGLDAQMIANANPTLKKRVGWLAYVDAIVRSLRKGNRVRMRYSVDDTPARSMTAHSVLVGNCGLLPANIVLIPDASIDDGILDVVALRPRGPIGWVQIWVKIVWENGVLRRTQVGRKLLSYTKEVRTLRYMQGRRFVARFQRPEEFELDGDPFGEAVALSVTVKEHALTVRVP